MADTKTSAETAATALDGTELTRIVQSGSSKKTTLAVAGHQFRGARARMSSDDTAQNVAAGDTAVSFDIADFDTDSFWSAGSPTRLTIPAGKGITHVELTGQAYVTSSTDNTSFTVQIQHRDSSDTLLRTIGTRFSYQAASRALGCATGPLEVSEGDYFQLFVREGSDTSVTIEGDNSNQTFLALHVIGMEPV